VDCVTDLELAPHPVSTSDIRGQEFEAMKHGFQGFNHTSKVLLVKDLDEIKAHKEETKDILSNISQIENTLEILR
jgi:hypothetical protein